MDKTRHKAFTGGHEGEVALVTGASGGIGEAYARGLASLGYDLILVARRKDRLDAIAGELERRHAVKAEALRCDLSRDCDISKIERHIEGTDALTMVVNNAGFGTTGRFSDVDAATLTAMVAVHALAPARLARAALPHMVERGRGAIINVASTSAFVLFPGNATYSATKSYLITLSRVLALELKGTGIKVQALCPGFTRSGFHETEHFKGGKSVSFPDALWMTAEEVVRRSLDALGRKRVVFVPGLINRLMYVHLRGLTACLARRMFR